MEEQNHTSLNGYSSKDILNQIWNKIESIENKLDVRLSELDKKVITLELVTLRKDGDEVKLLNALSSSIEDLKISSSVTKSLEKKAEESKGISLNRKNLYWAAVGSLAIVIEMAAQILLLVK